MRDPDDTPSRRASGRPLGRNVSWPPAVSRVAEDVESAVELTDTTNRTVSCSRIQVPALSTVGFGYGYDTAGTGVAFVGNQRVMRTIGEAIRETYYSIDVDVPDRCVIATGVAADEMAARWT